MSIRFRLTLLYTAILALTVIAFSTILFVTQTRTTYESIKVDLIRQASFSKEAERRPPRPPDSGNLQTERLPELTFPSGALPGRWTQTRSITGAVTGRTFDLGDTSLPLSAQGLATVQAGGYWFEMAQVEEQPLLIYSKLSISWTGVTQIVQVAYPIAQAQGALNSLRLMLLAGSGLAVVVAFAVGWVLAGAALRPIQDITHTAQTIGAERDFGRRVQHVGPADEIGQLATTFDQMLAELESAYRQLEAALDSQRRFVADASHELRTPLTTVRGNVELLQRNPPIAPAERAEVLADTTAEVDRLIRLVNQLLALARADAGQTLRCAPIPLKPLLEDVCRQAKLLAPATTVCCEPLPDVSVIGDRDALKQVLLILVDNAHTHTAPGTAVTLSCLLTDDQVAISVRDTGPGIPPDVLPHIFERFYRGEVARSGPGAGLGLAIARELTAAQGGTLEVQSELGRGSVFTVSLPLA
ncbi:MAG: two-component system, OmpR family, sensor kinase [Chloroflexota bacterium]|nr:two-component system, OmpR family, sensor kinase [Chloroflexota bacterium]